MADQANTPTPAEFVRTDDFTSAYANNVLFEPSVWNLKMIFGELDQHGSKSTVEQHTSITLPWLQAKIMRVFLDVNIAFYEAENGKIDVPTHLLPSPQAPPPELEGHQREVAEMVYKKLQKLLAEL